MSHSGEYYYLRASVTIIGLLWWKDTDFLNVSAGRELKNQSTISSFDKWGLHPLTWSSTDQRQWPLSYIRSHRRRGHCGWACQITLCHWWKYSHFHGPGLSDVVHSQKLWPRPVLSASKKEAIVPYSFHKKPWGWQKNWSQRVCDDTFLHLILNRNWVM